MYKSIVQDKIIEQVYCTKSLPKTTIKAHCTMQKFIAQWYHKHKSTHSFIAVIRLMHKDIVYKHCTKGLYKGIEQKNCIKESFYKDIIQEHPIKLMHKGSIQKYFAKRKNGICTLPTAWPYNFMLCLSPLLNKKDVKQ